MPAPTPPSLPQNWLEELLAVTAAAAYSARATDIDVHFFLFSPSLSYFLLFLNITPGLHSITAFVQQNPFRHYRREPFTRYRRKKSQMAFAEL